MCSYNKINQIYSCQNNETLNYHLREIMGFDGFVMSDWGAVYGKADSYISAGCDQEQGRPRFYNMTALKEVDIKKIDKAVYRIVKSFIKFGLFDEERKDNFNANVTSKKSIDFAQHSMEQSTVLLKNKNDTLPLDYMNMKNKSILILGNAAAYPLIHGFGSGYVKVDHFIPPLWAFCDAMGIERIPLNTN